MPETPTDKKPVGRPPVLDERKRRTVIALLANGSSQRVAARYVGCAPSTITRTMLRDPEFADAVFAAEQNAEIEALRLLRNAARKDRYWRAAAWLLERKNPRDFAARPHTALSNEQIVQMLVRGVSPVTNAMSDEEFDKVLARFDDLLDQIGENRENAATVLAPPRPESVTIFDYESLPLANCATCASEGLDDLCNGDLSQDDAVEGLRIMPADATESPK